MKNEAQAVKPYTLKLEDRPEYLYAFVESDSRDYERASQYWREIAERFAATDHLNLLVEKGLSPKTTLTDAFELVSEFPRMFTNVRLAFVDPDSGNQEVNEFAETVATNRGIVGRVFQNFAEAEDWLLDR